jgi:hypothetical protein
VWHLHLKQSTVQLFRSQCIGFKYTAYHTYSQNEHSKEIIQHHSPTVQRAGHTTSTCAAFASRPTTNNLHNHCPSYRSITTIEHLFHSKPILDAQAIIRSIDLILSFPTHPSSNLASSRETTIRPLLGYRPTSVDTESTTGDAFDKVVKWN